MADLPIAMDFAALRQQGIALLEQMNGGVWTDFNVHDPGITILEALCYVMTDLAYRSGHSVPDLLASAGTTATASLYTAPEILTTNPVTITDLRKLALDVPGVKNVWVERTASKVDLYYFPGNREVYYPSKDLSQNPNFKAMEPVKLKGVYQVLIEISELSGIDGSKVRSDVAQRLHQNRPLCEDFAEVRVMAPQDVQVQMAVEIDRVEDAEELMAEILLAIEEQLSPVIPTTSAEQMLESGVAVEDIFDGPLLQRGVVTDQALSIGDRRTSLHGSDIIHALMDVPGVRAIRSLSMSAGGGNQEQWLLPLDDQRVPRLDVLGSQIVLERQGILVAVDLAKANAKYQALIAAKYQAAPSEGTIFDVPAGQDRELASYHSLLHHFPVAYAVGETGLPDSASDQRKAQAKQLKGYLMLFDQLLANEFAQLVQAGNLLSFQDDGMRTYFSLPVDDDTLSLQEMRTNDLSTYEADLDAMTENSDAATVRKGRFLNHLLARFAEEMTDYALVLPQALPPGESSAAVKVVNDKRAFLRAYPEISSGRGSGRNYLGDPNATVPSGLEERISLRLGLTDDERPLLVEHILLRPLTGDDPQIMPLLAASELKDPFSLQLSFVFPAGTGRLQTGDRPLRRLVERTVREETPAHLTPYVQWLSAGDFANFKQVYTAWLGARRAYYAEDFGLAI